MWDIIGHERAVESLRTAIERGRLAHALIFTGPPGAGKTRLALELAKALDCTGEDPPCGTCVHCRQIESGAHPDVTVIVSAEGKESISIAQVRELREGAALRPFQARFKVIVISGAEALTAQAADALLKTLEEPQPQVRIILTAIEREALPATILSRCTEIALAPVDAATIRDALVARGADTAGADRLARLSGGSVGWALTALTQPKTAQAREEALAAMAGVFGLDLAGRLDLAEKLAGERRDRGGVRRNLELLLVLTRDLLLMEEGLEPRVAVGAVRDRLRDAAGRYSLAEIDGWLRSIEVAMARLDSNVDPRLSLESLLLAHP